MCCARLAHDWNSMEIWTKIIIKFAFIAIFRVSNFCVWMARSRIHRFSSFSRPKERRKKHQFVKLLYPTTFSVVQFVNYTANQDFHFVSLFFQFLYPYFFTTVSHEARITHLHQLLFAISFLRSQNEYIYFCWWLCGARKQNILSEKKGNCENAWNLAFHTKE